MGLRSLVEELKRRHVFKVAAVYLGVGWLLMEASSVVFPALQLPEWTMTLVVVLVFLGFPITLIAAWAFDLTPEGVVRTPPASEANGGAPPPDGASAAETAGAQHATTVAEGRDHDGVSAGARSTRQPPPNSLAVLPFRNLSGAPEDDYFSEGVSEDLLAQLAKIDSLRIISRASAWRYKERRKAAREIGRELGVACILDGSVRRQGNRVRIGASLVDASRDVQLWAETYDRELEDIFEIQSDVAARIADSLATHLSPQDAARIGSAPTSDLEAYDLYLQGRYAWNRRTEAELLHSVDLLRAALERDSRFATAHAALADAYVTLGIYGVRPPHEVMPAARRAGERAMALSDEATEALTPLACVSALYEWDWAEAERRFRAAIERAPGHATAHQWFATNCLLPLGRFEEAAEQLRAAEALDPVSPTVRASFAILEYLRRDFEAARSALDELLADEPDFAPALYFRGLVLLAEGRDPDAATALEQAVELSGRAVETSAALGCALAGAGREREARELLAELEGRPSYASPFRLAQLDLALGDTEGALARLESAVEVRAADLAWLDVLPTLDGLRGEPRFVAVREVVFPATSPSP